jgi:hypothetical protein
MRGKLIGSGYGAEETNRDSAPTFYTYSLFIRWAKAMGKINPWLFCF